MNRETLADHAGQLCILYEYTLTDSPEIARSFYSIGTSTRAFVADYGTEKIGSPMTRRGDGLFEDRDGLSYRLIDGGRTKPIHFDRVPVPVPKVRPGIELRWRDGWEKYLKTKGWVAA